MVIFGDTIGRATPKESLNNAEPCWGRGRHAREKTKD